jgi:hypothetical protein
MKKHLKIMSGRKTLYENKEIRECDGCLMFDGESNPRWCNLAGKKIICNRWAIYDPIPKECPLQDVPSDITYKD